MAILHTQINPRSAESTANAVTMLEQVNTLRTPPDRTHESGGSAAQVRHSTRDKLLVHERINRLFDPGSPFLELSALAVHEVYDEEAAAADIVTGIGWVEGVECTIVDNDATVKGGTYYPLTVKKHLRAQVIVPENRLPYIYLVDPGGANLPYQDEMSPDRRHFGRVFFNQVNMSVRGTPQIAAAVDSCIADGIYVLAMSDRAVVVCEQAIILPAGLSLMKIATGEVVNAEELGGANMRCKVSGVADHYAEDNGHTLVIVRRCVADLNWHKQGQLQYRVPRTPLYPVEELYGVIPADSKQPYDMCGMVVRLVGGSEFGEFKTLFSTTLIYGFVYPYGYPVTILANNRTLFAEAVQKGAHFIELTCQRGIPLPFLQNITGLMVGQKYEASGVAEHGAKLVTAVAYARVPKSTVLIGGSFGAGSYGICGRAYDPRFLWIWSNARIDVIGGEQAAEVLIQVKRERAERADQRPGVEEEVKIKASILEQYEHQGHPYYFSARSWNDDVIDLAQTREVLALVLSVAPSAPIEPTAFGMFRM